MKNLNLKHYQQAYHHHPYDIPANNNNYNNNNNNNNNPQPLLETPYTTSANTFYNNPKCNNVNEAYNYIPTNLTVYNGCKSLSKSSISSCIRNNTQNPSLLASTSASTSSSPAPTPTPPTLGGYLANQQQQRLQQQQGQQQLNQIVNPHTRTSQQTYNMLSLNQTNTSNYNFQFNANYSNSNNSNNTSSHNYNLNAHTNNRNTNNSNNNNNNNHNNNNNSNNNNNINTNTNNHNNRALSSRPQRPNSLNIPAMASLATPTSYSAYSSTMAQINNESSCSTSCHSAPTVPCNFSANHFYNNPRENFFNFSINQQQQQQQQHHHHHHHHQKQQQQQQQHLLLQNYNNHNYSLQQHQENYNNYQANQQQHQRQQQQQHLQQFQLLQQQLKQQQQNAQFQLNKNNNERNIINNHNDNNCNLATPAAYLPTSSSAALDGSSNTSQQCTISSSNCVITSNNTNTNSADNPTNNHCDKLTMDAGEIANFLASELFMQQLVSMECMQTGVPTLTTPTLTPTTLKSIEESFIQLTSEPINAPYQAGFIPPPLGSYISTPTNTTNNNNSILTTTTTSVAGISPNAALNNVYVGDTSTGASLPDYGNINDTESENSQGSWTANNLNEENSMATTDTSSAATDTISFQNGLNGLGVNTLNNSNSSTNEFTTLAALAVATAAAKISNSGNHNNNTSSSATTTTTTTPTRRGGGRRPTTNSNMTPEEEEKRRIRRERNKLAAARCRKRRVDQTNELTEEVQMLEKKREELQKQIESLNGTKQDLEFLLEAHRPTCQRVEAADILSVNTFEGLMPSTIPTANDNITGIDTSLATTARSISPLDLKPVLNDQLLAQIKDEPLDSALDSNSSLDQDGPPSPKRLLLSNNNPMIPPALPNVATLSASLAAASASLNTPIVTAAPVSFGSMYSNNPSLCAPLTKPNSKQRPNSLPTIPRNLAQNLGLNVNENKPPTDINGVAIQTPSTGMFNFDSLMDGGTGLTPVSGPLVPNCSSQNKHPLELVTPTSEPSKLVSL